MTKQLSDCCKAEILLTGKDRPNAYECKRCGRIIGTPIISREIEFRGWCIHLEWMCEIISIDFLEHTVEYKGRRNDLVYCQDLSDDFILLQYTGLKDRDGNKIYEGDIIDVNNKTRKIVWDINRISVGWFAPLIKEDEFHNSSNVSLALIIEDCKVIGNIYQNPELLTITK